MKHTHVFRTLLFAALASLFVASCAESTTGSLQLSIAGRDGKARSTTVFEPLELADAASFTVYLTGTGGTVDYDAGSISGDSTLADIPVGTYDLLVTAYNTGGAVVGQSDILAIVISSGITTTQAVTIRPQQVGTGNLNIAYTWPAAIGIQAMTIQLWAQTGTSSGPRPAPAMRPAPCIRSTPPLLNWPPVPKPWILPP